MTQQEASRLLDRYLNNECSAEERALVEKWYAGLVEEYDWQLDENRRHAAQQAIKQRIDRELGWAPRPAARLRKLVWYAAASVLLAAAVTFLFVHRQQVQPVPAIAADLPPGGNKATLVLANGQSITLDDAAEGQLARQSGSSISKSNGQLVYTPGAAETAVVNTLITPKGGQYRLSLPDGSKVWLNALSRLEFPAAFTGASREVRLKGEAYFEIAENAAQPFRVSVNGITVEVLGTHFNINAYPDEQQLTTTLLEGKLNVKGRNTVTLRPGQQAVVSAAAGPQQVELVAHADTETATAWVNGYFQFSSAGVTDIMKQIARWYDIDVRYEGQATPRKFSGAISRGSSLSEVLKGLSATGINVKMEGRTVTVMP